MLQGAEHRIPAGSARCTPVWTLWVRRRFLVSLKDVAEAAYVLSRLPPGLEKGLYEVASFSPEVPNFPNGCHVCEVEIDPETGTTRVLRYVVVDDVGTVINQLTLEGQIH